MQRSIVAISTTNELLQRFANDRFPNRHVEVTYVKGARMIALRLHYTPPHELKSFQGRLMGKIADNIRATVAWSRNSYAGIHGVTIRRLPQSSQDVMTRVVTPVAYRSMSGRIGRQWSITVFTNAGDRDVMAVLAGIDVVGMNKAMETPLDTITDARPVVMGPDFGLLRYPQDAGQIGNVPPPPPDLDPNHRAAKAGAPMRSAPAAPVPASAQPAPIRKAEAAPASGEGGSLMGWLAGAMASVGGADDVKPSTARPAAAPAPVKPEPGFKGAESLAAKVCVMRAGKRSCPGK